MPQYITYNDVVAINANEQCTKKNKTKYFRLRQYDDI